MGQVGGVGLVGLVEAMLGVGGDVGYGGCEPRVGGMYKVQKGIVQY